MGISYFGTKNVFFFGGVGFRKIILAFCEIHFIFFSNKIEQNVFLFKGWQVHAFSP